MPGEVRSRLRVVAAVLSATTLACTPEVPSDPYFAPVPVASSEASLSDNASIALADEDTACVINSYEFRVHCSDRSGSVVGTFGREGEGPGEFLNPVDLERGQAGTVVVFDLELNRMTYFEPSGLRVSETRLPPLFVGPTIRDGSVFGILLVFDEPSGVPAEVDAQSGQILWQRPGIWDIEETECGSVYEGLPSPGGRYAFRACQSELMFLDHRDAESATVVQSPTYTAELPNERDVAEYLEDMASLAGGMSLPRSALEPYAAGFREDPKLLFLRPSSLAFDSRERLWVATTRDRDAFSYLDIWVGAEYAGTVRIRDRLMGYDLLGSTLVALVERPPGRDGIAKRAIDWYDTSGLEWGS